MRAKFVDCGVVQHVLWQQAQQRYNVPVDVNTEAFNPSALPAMLDGFDIAISDHTRFPPEILSQCRSLRHFVYFGTGAASILDLGQAARMGIEVHTIRNYGDTTMAELCVGLMMAAARQIAEQHLVLRQGGWKKLQGMELRGRRIGLIGFGGIGREVARICQAIGMEVVAWNRSPFSSDIARTVTLETVLATSDVVSLHLALSDQTRGFMDCARLRTMKPGAILINTARGALIDEPALVKALHDGHIAHAALDVFQEEPLPTDHPFRTVPNVTLTAHCGFWTENATINQVHMILDIARRLICGAPA
jgi:D-3-phosphoglycerate dehydrogenase / 2-oxoglutarate reductase